MKKISRADTKFTESTSDGVLFFVKQTDCRPANLLNKNSMCFPYFTEQLFCRRSPAFESFMGFQKVWITPPLPLIFLYRQHYY